MQAFRTVMMFVLSGGLLGAIGASFAAPGILAWYSEPGHGQALCSCAELVRDTANRFIQLQLVGTGLGATMFMLLGIAWVRSRKKNHAAAKVEPPAQPPPPPSLEGPAAS